MYASIRNAKTRQAILDGAISGGVTLNGILLHVAQDDLPFGGDGASGIGAYHGRDGFRRLSHPSAVRHWGAPICSSAWARPSGGCPAR
jgi:coniferyl-aldehyde dehydrogenase